MKLSPQSLILIACLIIHSSISQANDLSSIEDQMEKMDLNTALVVQSQAIDEYPLWSEDGKYLAANVAGKWYKIDLQHLILEKTKWRGNQPLGVLTSNSSISEATLNEVKIFKSSTTFKPREYKTKHGHMLQLRQSGFKTEFVISKEGGNPVTQWSSGSENCHSLTANENEKYIAFICELNGVFIYKIGE